VFSLISPDHETEIKNLIEKIKSSEAADPAVDLEKIIEKIRADIPEKKRISLGRYSIVKRIGIFIFSLLGELDADAMIFGAGFYENLTADSFVRSLGIQLISLYGEKTGSLKEVLSFFEKAASDEDWIVRECSSGFVRKLVKKYPERMHEWYLRMVKSENPMQRRFASESIRPVADNGWLKKRPDFAFSILEHLYYESSAYPRTSVGNSLSDWMRIDEARSLQVVRELADNGDENSYWIACRACRNLVKKDPLLVMDILRTDSYVYKDRKFYRKDCQ